MKIMKKKDWEWLEHYKQFDPLVHNYFDVVDNQGYGCGQSVYTLEILYKLIIEMCKGRDKLSVAYYKLHEKYKKLGGK